MNTVTKLTLVTCFALAAAAARGQDPVVYKQMLHVPLGNAALAVSPDGEFLRATRLGAAAEDGFRTLLPGNANSWRGKFIVNLEAGQSMRFDPVADGVAIAPLDVSASATGLSAFVEFTSSLKPGYMVRVKKASDLVATWFCRPGHECIPPDDPEPPTGPGPGGGIIIDFEPLPDPDIDDPTLFEERFKQDNNGNCVHALRMTDDTGVYVGGQHLGDGDEVVIVERAPYRQARYPYAGFDAMEVRSSSSQMVFVNEASR